jgi:elongation factor Ts
VEVNCESDFVARTDDFQQLVKDVLDLIDAAGASATDAWLVASDGPVQRQVAACVAKLGENMKVPRMVRYDAADYVGQYIHMGGKIGVQVALSGVTPALRDREEVADLVKELAMQIAAASPQYVRRSDVPGDILEKERAIYRAQMEGSGKPANVIDKIVEGKLASFYAQTVLPDQPSIRDPKMTVADVIAAKVAKLGAPVAVARFARLQVGQAPT